MATWAHWRGWIRVRVLRHAALGSICLHLAGLVGSSVAFVDVWNTRILLGILAPRFGVTSSIALVLLAGIVLLAAAAFCRDALRFLRRDVTPDAILRMRVAGYFAILFVGFCAFVLSIPETYSGPFRVRHPLLVSVFGVMFYGAYLVWVLALPMIRRCIPAGPRAWTDVACANVVLVLVLGEIGVRALAFVWATPVLVTDSSPSRIRREAERLSPGVLWYGFPINSGGHYDTEFVPRAKRAGRLVTSVGDSFSYGTVPHRYHFTTVAEGELEDTQIYNIGYPGIAPSDYVYLVEQAVSRWQPDLVTVQIFVGNDIYAPGAESGEVRWYDADRYLLAIAWYRLRILRRERVRRSELALGAEHPVTGSTDNPFPWVNDVTKEIPTHPEEVYLSLETRNASALGVELPGAYERFFTQIDAIGRAAGDVPLAFVLIPEEFQVEDWLWEIVQRRSGRTLERDRPQKILDEELTARGYEVMDLLPLLRKVEPLEDGRRHLYHAQDTHFNARGNRVAGIALAFLIRRVLGDGKVERLGWRVELPLRIDLGSETAPRWLGAGWYAGRAGGGKSFAWSKGDRSDLSVRLPAGTNIALRFEVLPFTLPGGADQGITIAVNGAVLEEVMLHPGTGQYSASIPAGLVHEGMANRIEFRYRYARVPRDVIPDSTDKRDLAVRWSWIEFAAPQP